MCHSRCVNNVFDLIIQSPDLPIWTEVLDSSTTHCMLLYSKVYFCNLNVPVWDRGSTVVKVLCYKSEVSHSEISVSNPSYRSRTTPWMAADSDIYDGGFEPPVTETSNRSTSVQLQARGAQRVPGS